MLVGGALAFLPPSRAADQSPPHPHFTLFLAVNAGTIGMLVGFWQHHSLVISLAGLLVTGAFLWIGLGIWREARRTAPSASTNGWYHALTLVALFLGLACGEALAFGFAQQSYGYVRLAHIHLLLLGFITLTLISTVHQLLPTILNTALSSSRVTRLVPFLMVLGVAMLISGFLYSLVPVEMAAGAMLVAGGTLYAANLFRTWMASSHGGNAASDHLLIGTFFLLAAILLGSLVAANSLSNTPVLPFGTLHLVAYTHMALVGFIVNAIMGVLSHLVPNSIAMRRAPSNQGRGPYLDRLTTTMDRWRAVQLSGLSLGTMGLAVLASLTWNVPLSSVYIGSAMWISFGLLLSSLLLFSVKLTLVFVQQPEDAA